MLDLCAAPGGKSTHLAALIGDRGSVVAVERNPKRARVLERERPAHARRASIRVEVGDAARRAPEGDLRPRARRPALLGARHAAGARPTCAGASASRRSRRWRGRRSRIFAAGAEALRPGGVLVYSTCTISPTENEHLIADFLDANPDFQLDDLAAELPGSRSRRTRRREPAFAEGSALMTLPHRDDTAGFFIARLRQELSVEAASTSRSGAAPRPPVDLGPQCPNCGEPWLRPDQPARAATAASTACTASS